MKPHKQTYDATTIRYQLTNHLDSASIELDENADIISYEEYHPFGTTSYRSGRSVTEVSLKRYKFQMKEKDNETGLHYHGARYYAPWLGRWTSTDPKQHEFQDMSPFCGMGNNPVLMVDYDGERIFMFFENGEQDKEAFRALIKELFNEGVEVNGYSGAS